MNTGKSSQLGKHGFGSLHNVTIIRTSCFDTDFASQMKLTTLPLMVKPVFKNFLSIQRGNFGICAHFAWQNLGKYFCPPPPSNPGSATGRQRKMKFTVVDPAAA